ncbi:MAG: TonB-dependent receptor [Bacteroidota bacterium]
MSRNLFVFLVFMSLALSLRAQTNCTCTLEGYVTAKETKESIPGAQVYIKGTKKHSQSDSKGYFRINALCPGNYILICQMSSFDPIEIPISINDELKHNENFRLESHDEHLQEVIVSGKKTETSAQLRGSLSKQERAERDGLSLSEMMRGISGVQSLQTGSTISKPVIHGMHSSRVIILNQGIRQEGQQWGSEHAPEIDPFVSKNIQVIKGPAGLRYGGDAIGGIVMMEPDALPDTAGINGAIQSIYFTNGRQAVISGSIEGGINQRNGWGWRLQGTLKDGGNIQTASYFLANTGVREQNFSAALGYKKNKWSSDLFFSHFHSVIGIYLGSHIGNVNDLENSIARTRPFQAFTPLDFSREIERPNQDVTHSLGKFKTQYRLAQGRAIRTTLALQNDERLELDVLRAGKNINNLQFILRTFNGEILFDESNSTQAWKGQFGINFQLQGNITSGKEVASPTLTSSLLPNYFQNTFGLFAIERFVKEKYEIEIGLRIDEKILDVHRPKSNYSSIIYRHANHYLGLSGSLGLKYRWNEKIENHLILARAFRAPGVNELFSYGVHHGAAAFEVGDPNLKGETAYNMSLNTLFIPKNLHIELGVYNNYIQNFIYLRPMVDAGNALYFTTVRGAFPGFSYEQINAVFQGIDAQVNYQISPKLSFQQKTSIVHAFDASHNFSYLVNIPANRFEYTINYRWMQEKQYVSLGIIQVGEQTRVEPGSDYAAPPKGYQLVQANWGISLKKIDVGIRISNAFNTAYRDYLNRFRYFADDQGRNISFRVLYKI